MVQGKPTFYRLTSKGRALHLRPDDADLAKDGHRVLNLVDAYGFKTVIRSGLGRYPERFVEGWLTELEAKNLIEAIFVDPPNLADIAKKTARPALEEDEMRLFAEDANFADISLSHLGVYIAQERVSNRPPSGKSPQETVALVVEDDPDQLDLAVLRLTNAGYPVRTADSVKALYASIQTRTPDAILLDVMLPDGDGFDVLSTLRLHPTYTLLPIVMVTAKTAKEDIARGLALGADGYITKPYGKNTLDYVLRYVMQQDVFEAAPRENPMRRAGLG